jgi:beta-phosphoglucomutase-like phosphatase (HAD superfamily)
MGKLKGVIFDFNGTLFWDSKLHEKAWRAFALEHGKKQLSDYDMKNHVHGRINHDIIQYILNKKLKPDEIQQLSDIKEKIYRKLVFMDKSFLKLAPGAEELLNYLKEIRLPMNIATSAEGSNIDFYFEYLKIDRWFEPNKIVYDDGTIKPKPAPDIYIKAAANIGIDIQDCLVAEDSLTGIMSAQNAKSARIIYVENDSPINFEKVKDMVYAKVSNLQMIKNFLS